MTHHNEYPFHETSTDASSIPPMTGIPEETEPSHFGATARAPGKKRRKPSWRRDVAITLALFVVTIIEAVFLLAFYQR